jgi:CDP-diacylglycerol--serine O-phosphatidyltransferase
MARLKKNPDGQAAEPTKRSLSRARSTAQSDAASTPVKTQPKPAPKTTRKSIRTQESSTENDSSDEGDNDEVVLPRNDHKNPGVESNVKTETIQGPNGNMILRQTTTTTVTTITIEEEQSDIPITFPNYETTPIYRRASLFRSFVLADWITTLNCVCGVASILFCLNYLANGQEDKYLLYAFACLPIALLADIFDGYVARLRKSHSPWGSDLDSLSDCISFTLAPAALGFTCGLRSFWDCLALCYFTFCGISRLARYNVTSQTVKQGEKVKYYEGFPVPTSLILDGILFYFYSRGLILDNFPWGTVVFLGKEFHLFSIVFVLWGCLFVSASIRIPKP